MIRCNAVSRWSWPSAPRCTPSPKKNAPASGPKNSFYTPSMTSTMILPWQMNVLRRRVRSWTWPLHGFILVRVVCNTTDALGLAFLTASPNCCRDLVTKLSSTGPTTSRSLPPSHTKTTSKSSTTCGCLLTYTAPSALEFSDLASTTPGTLT